MTHEGIYMYPATQIVEATCYPYRVAKLTGATRQTPRDHPDARKFEGTLRTRAGQMNSHNHSVYVVTTLADGVHYYMVTDDVIKEGEGFIEEAW